MVGFNVMDHWDLYPEALKQVGEWVASDRIKYRTQILEGLESAPEGLLRLFRGDHLGKLVVHVSD
jgi:NADPH-dependent curcumin reductase CurA